ncbi:MAG: bifunctional 23S rRNA (guanine(2069)-N(7))-methyltransferase RlmK/23S rRNA (guanine(2445)-N(2))-methyltransferase RlmL [Gammaproteobacteria bacterium]|nr:MAG: bifunctional 23S rRNA (guanine(2069)-N(7))-methyltransferase RlmK/23S rRNA (guanine(2445)-N(2))-methyltransferase RlmL [Gammaproteobacteria bacterium]
MLKNVIWAACPMGLEYLLADELARLGMTDARPGRLGVSAQGDWPAICRVLMASRLTSRVFLVLAQGTARDADGLRQLAGEVDWQVWLAPEMPYWIHAQGQAGQLKHPHFAAQVLKDGIVDAFRGAGKSSPVIDRDRARVQIQLTLGKQAMIGLDLAGRSLHQRGYRLRDTAAPIKENVAAGMLLRAGWPDPERPVLVDPMCGSGTLLAEAWMMASDMAPGLLRQDFAVKRAPWYPKEAWEKLLAELRAAHDARLAWAREHVRLYGSDIDPEALKAARANLAVLGDGIPVTWSRQDACTLVPEPGATGVLVCNPPYGERLGDAHRLRPLYRQWGKQLKASWGGWTLVMITSSPDLASGLPLAPDKTWKLRNGPLDCVLHRYEIRSQSSEAHPEQGGQSDTATGNTRSAFANRLAKNWKARQKWARKQGVQAFRVYDADMPEYALAIDWYDGWVHVQEYAPPPSVRPEKARKRLNRALDDISEVLGVDPEFVFLKQRRPQKGSSQYGRQAELGYEKVIEEACARLWVNLSDYLDTGVFLDHRPTRLWIRDHAQDKRFLNLFCYTATATVQAALGGAARTVSVDLSNTYLDWAKRNLKENGLLGGAHRLHRADVLKWLTQCREPFDLIFMDPPTFSNSKKMDSVLDIQRDHVKLIDEAMRILAPGGTLVFSTNFRRFRMDEALSARYALKEVSVWSVPDDFARNRKIHRCWHIRARHE